MYSAHGRFRIDLKDFRFEVLLLKEDPNVFISLQEKEIVLLKNIGHSYDAIGTRLGIPSSEVQKTYTKVLDKLYLLSSVGTDLESLFPCKTITDFLDQMGVSSKLVGKDELAESIRLSYLNPRMADNIAKELIPALAITFECSEVLVRGRLYSAARQAFSNSHEEGTPAHKFFEQEKIRNRGSIDLRRFLMASHAYITELSYPAPT